MYERYGEWKRIIRQWASAYPDTLFRRYTNEFRSIQDHYGRKIIEEVMSDKYYAAIYRIACKELGLKDSVEIAISVVRLPLNWKFSRLKDLLGLTPHKNKNIRTIITTNYVRTSQDLQQQSISAINDMELEQSFLRT